MIRVLITGGAGFIGKRLTETLRERGGFDVHALSRDELDVTSAEQVKKIVSKIKPDWIFHLAADTRQNNDPNLAEELTRTNVEGTRYMLDAAIRNHVKAFVSVGTMAEHGDVPTPFTEDGPHEPNISYGMTKWAATQLACEYGREKLPAVVLRFPNVYGLGMTEPTFMKKLQEAARGGPRVPTSPVARRDFLHVDDAVSALILAAERINACRGECINVCSGEDTPVTDVLHMAEKILNRTDIGEIQDSPSTSRISYYGRNDKAKRILGWSPKVSLRDGLEGLLLSEDKKM